MSDEAGQSLGKTPTSESRSRSLLTLLLISCTAALTLNFQLLPHLNKYIKLIVNGLHPDWRVKRVLEYSRSRPGWVEHSMSVDRFYKLSLAGNGASSVTYICPGGDFISAQATEIILMRPQGLVVKGDASGFVFFFCFFKLCYFSVLWSSKKKSQTPMFDTHFSYSEMFHPPWRQPGWFGWPSLWRTPGGCRTALAPRCSVSAARRAEDWRPAAKHRRSSGIGAGSRICC